MRRTLLMVGLAAFPVLGLCGAAIGDVVGQVVLTHPDPNTGYYWSAQITAGAWAGSNPFFTFCVENQEYADPGLPRWYKPQGHGDGGQVVMERLTSPPRSGGDGTYWPRCATAT
jgi:hypothetical protein